MGEEEGREDRGVGGPKVLPQGREGVYEVYGFHLAWAYGERASPVAVMPDILQEHAITDSRRRYRCSISTRGTTRQQMQPVQAIS